jgi:hypothetical protein
MEHKNGNIRSHFGSTCTSRHSKKALSPNYKPATLENYRYLLRRFGRLVEAEGIAPSALNAR